jgi:hypothetical protein
MRRSRKVFIAGAAVVLVGGIAVSGAIAGSDTPPARPGYVDANGRVDVSKMPRRVPALDSSGKTIGYVNTTDLFADAKGAGEDATSLALYDDERSDKPNGKRLPVGGGGIIATQAER